MPQPPSITVPCIALPWIVRLRYAMAAGQMAIAILAEWLLGIDLPLGWIAIPLVVVVLSNVWLANSGLANRAERYRESALIGWVFVLDTLCLTAVLMLSGGPSNPFTLLFLVHITLSATILTRRQTWGLGVLATACFALLFRIYRPVPQLEMHHGAGAGLHLSGMWVGFAIATFLVAMFAGRISELLRQHEESSLRMQEELARKDRLASLVTLAAGAAHELSTPLATIAVVSRELENYATRTVKDNAIAEDSRLIRSEVERCRQILQSMSAEGAEPAGEAVSAVMAGEVLSAVHSSFSSSPALEISAGGDGETILHVPRRAVEQAIVALVRNAFESGSGESRVVLAAARAGSMLRFEVRDCGCGMSAQTLRHVGEPFFTTKEPGKGMGLGIFLVRTLADRIGGRFTIESRPGQGTTASLDLPISGEAELATEQAIQDSI